MSVDDRFTFRRLLRTLPPALALTWLGAGALMAEVSAAPSPSLMAQNPTFLNLSVAPNIVLALDNSESMLFNTLPSTSNVISNQIRPFFENCNGSTHVCDAVFIQTYCDVIDNFQEVKIEEFQQYASLIRSYNPLAYNPGKTYSPWTYDSVRFPEADPSAVATDADGFVRSNVRHDARFAGPNTVQPNSKSPISGSALVYGATGSGIDSLLVDTGANALNYVPAPFGDGSTPVNLFRGAAKPGGANQDLFTRNLRQPAAVCKPPTDPKDRPKVSVPSANCPGESQTATETKTVAYVTQCNAQKVLSTWKSASSATSPPDPRPKCGTNDQPDGPSIDVYETVEKLETPSYACKNSGYPYQNGSNGSQCCSKPWKEVTTERPCEGDECCDGSKVKSPGSFEPDCTGLNIGAQTCTLGRYYPVACRSAIGSGYGDFAKYMTETTPAHYFNFVRSRIVTQKELPRLPGDRLGLFLKIVEIDRNNYKIGGRTFGAASDANMRNFANWYTYHRNRLFASIGATAEALSSLTASTGLDQVRLGYGAINQFAGGVNPYAVTPWKALTPRPDSAATTFTAAQVPPVALPAGTPPAGFVDNQGMLVRGVRPFVQDSGDRREVFNWLFALRAVGATPNREAVDSVGRYFSRSDELGPYGDFPGIGGGRSGASQVSCRRNNLLLVTDGEWTNLQGGGTSYSFQPLIEDRPAVPTSLDSQDKEASTSPLSARSNLRKPVQTGAGLYAGRTFPADPDASNPQPQFATVAGDPTKTFTDVAYYWWSRDLRPDLSNNVTPREKTSSLAANESFWQNLTSYVIAFGVTASYDTTATRNAVRDATVVDWPTVDLTSTIASDTQCGGASGCGRRNDTLRGALAARGDFLSSQDPESLASSIQSVLTGIATRDGAGTGLTAARSSLQSGDLLYLAGFTTGTWVGDVRAYNAVDYLSALGTSTPLPAPVWSAASRSTSVNARQMITRSFYFNPSNSEITDLGPRYFRVDGIQSPNLLADLEALVVYENVGTRQNVFRRNGGNEDSTENVVSYLRGSKLYDLPKGPARPLGSFVGPIVNSQPLYSRAPNFGYGPQRVPAAAGTAGAAAYSAHLKNNFDFRRPALYVSTNFGVVQAFDARNDATNGGKELFAYVPYGSARAQAFLPEPGYSFQYATDGPLVHGDVYLDGKWKTVLVGTTGAGGATTGIDQGGVFAVDITNPTNAADGAGRPALTHESALWEKVRAHHADLGLIVEPGVIGSALDGNWYYFVGNGYESQNDKARLLAFKIADGSIVSIPTDSDGGSNPASATPSGQPNGLGGVAPVYDNNGNIVAIYAGDRLGRLWKFDLKNVASGLTTTNVTVTKLFTTAEALVNVGGSSVTVRQPISAAPWIGAHPFGGRYIVFGTGKLYDTADLGNRAVQSVYAIREPVAGISTPLERTDLTQLTLSASPVTASGVSFRRISGTDAIDAGAGNGWFFDLSFTGAVEGERLLVSFQDDGDGFVSATSFSPETNGDPCLGGGSSFRYRLQLNRVFADNAFRGVTGLTPLDIGVSVVPTVTGTAKMTLPASASITTQHSLTAEELGKVRQAARAMTCRSRNFDRSTGGELARTQDDSCPTFILRTWRDLPVEAQ